MKRMSTNNTSATIGTMIIDRIIAGTLLHATCVHSDEHRCLVVWSSGAAEQLEALVAEHVAAETQHLLKRIARLEHSAK